MLLPALTPLISHLEQIAQFVFVLYFLSVCHYLVKAKMYTVRYCSRPEQEGDKGARIGRKNRQEKGEGKG